jgi:drug/metabolite transporter (DMT)-like permease
MIYLIIAILCSSAMAIIFKISENNKLNRYAVTTFNYITAVFISLILMLRENSRIPNIEVSNFLGEVNKVISNNNIFSIEYTLIWCLFLGGITGVLYLISLLMYQLCVHKQGMSLTGTFSKLGILVPTLLSISLWGEVPNKFQWIGIALSILSILIINLDFSSNKFNYKSIKWSLILLFFINGFTEFTSKIFEKYTLVQYKSLFLFFVFFTAFLLSLILLYISFKKGNSITKSDIITGICVGIPNLFSTFFLINSLKYIQASVAFPTYSVGTILVINVFGIVIFKEILSRKELLGILTTLIAILFLNI